MLLFERAGWTSRRQLTMQTTAADAHSISPAVFLHHSFASVYFFLCDAFVLQSVVTNRIYYAMTIASSSNSSCTNDCSRCCCCCCCGCWHCTHCSSSSSRSGTAPRAADLLHTNDGAAAEQRVAMTAGRHWSGRQAQRGGSQTWLTACPPPSNPSRRAVFARWRQWHRIPSTKWLGDRWSSSLVIATTDAVDIRRSATDRFGASP